MSPYLCCWSVISVVEGIFAYLNSFLKKNLLDYSSKRGIIGRGTVKPALSFPNAPTGAIYNSYTIQPFLQQLVKNGTITPNSHSYYPIHFSPSVTSITLGNAVSCVQFCAYHGTFNAGNSSHPIIVVYGVMPDESQGPCYPCGYSRDAFKNLCFVSSHELIESITDPYIGFAPYLNVAPGVLGWYAPTNISGEIGDYCSRFSTSQVVTTDGNGNKWTVSRGWSNRRNACYAPP